MTDLKLRAATADDAHAIWELLVAAEAVDASGEHYALEDVVEDLASPLIDLAHDWVVVEGEDGRLLAHASLMPRAPHDGTMLVSVDGTVRPDVRRTGIASALLPEILERARAHVAAREGDLRAQVFVHALESDTDLAAVAAASGMQPHRWQFVMLADLGPQRPGGALPEGYTLQTWEGVDDEELRAAHNSAFAQYPSWSPWSPEMWRQFVSGSRHHRPALSLLTRDGSGEVAAYVQAAEYDATEAVSGVREIVAVKVGTREGHRGRGLATSLLEIGLRRWREAGYDRAALDVDSANPSGANAVYERVGFVVDKRWVTYALD